MMASVSRHGLASALKSLSRGSCVAGRIQFRSDPPSTSKNHGLVSTQIQARRRYCDPRTLTYSMIYRFPHMKLLRAISRLKLFQTGLTVVVLPPVYAFYLLGEAPVSAVAGCTAISVFAGVMLYTFSHFFRKVVGFMYLDPSQTTLKVSHLTFWGRRKDVFMPVTDVMPVADGGDAPNELVVALKRYSTEDTLYFFARQGQVVDKPGFQKVFGSLQ